MEHLAGFVTPERLGQMERVLDSRTRFITVVLENIFHSHNASAVIRSCDCFGVQDVHIIEGLYKFKTNLGIAKGADNWLSLSSYNQGVGEEPAKDCLQQLKARGYRIVATALSEGSVPIQDLPVDQKIALCYGTEDTGLSDTILSLADTRVKIPMFGFTQSLNISVSVALSLNELSKRIRGEHSDWQLSEEERQEIKFNWLCQSVRNAKAIMDRFLQERSVG